MCMKLIVGKVFDILMAKSSGPPINCLIDLRNLQARFTKARTYKDGYINQSTFVYPLDQAGKNAACYNVMYIGQSNYRFVRDRLLASPIGVLVDIKFLILVKSEYVFLNKDSRYKVAVIFDREKNHEAEDRAHNLWKGEAERIVDV